MQFFRRSGLIGGHRGAPRLAPENTRASFERAIELGVDFIETDVRFSAEGIPILIHDQTTGRTTDLRPPAVLSELPLEQICALDAGSWFGSQFQGQRVLTLDEALHDFGRLTNFMLEIKPSPGRAKAQARAVVERVVKKALLDRVVFTSFDLKIVRALLELVGVDQVMGVAENEQQLDQALALANQQIAVHDDLVAAAIKRAPEIRLWVWTVNDREKAISLLHMGVAAIITDDALGLRRQGGPFR
jgi:glycerophosphoryl diester phosphodiesterase